MRPESLILTILLAGSAGCLAPSADDDASLPINAPVLLVSMENNGTRILDGWLNVSFANAPIALETLRLEPGESRDFNYTLGPGRHVVEIDWAVEMEPRATGQKGKYHAGSDYEFDSCQPRGQTAIWSVAWYYRESFPLGSDITLRDGLEQEGDIDLCETGHRSGAGFG